MTATEDLVVIVKTAGERTVDASLALLREQVSADRILVVDERQSETAIRRTYELGLERSAAWTMTLGADALLRAGAVSEFAAEANRMPADYFHVECRIFDKFTGLYRQAGQRMYRTKLLGLALQNIPLPGATMRSEYTVIQAMARLGHPSRRVALVAGLHDFEQYYRDIYRTAFVHALKHRSLVPSIVERCLTCWDDDDFKVALGGLYDGMTGGRARQGGSVPELVQAWLARFGLVEKPPLGAREYTPAFAQVYAQTVAEHAPPSFDTSDEPALKRTALSEYWNAYQDGLARRGWWKGTAGTIGRFLRRAGEALEGHDDRREA